MIVNNFTNTTNTDHNQYM